MTGKVRKVRRHLFGRRPVLQVVEMLLELEVDHRDLAHAGLERALVQVLVQCGDQRVLSVVDHLAQLQQHLATSSEVAQHATAERRAELRDIALDRLVRRVREEIVGDCDHRGIQDRERVENGE
ncbi:hypothetical protein PINS_up006417 [Pythium insidiosum]|nr:hypothetical protein PINS_up006417 [Pythium insidiosum]